MHFEQWSKLVAICNELSRSEEKLAGIVITHGTATLEETAYFLDLTLKLDMPIVLVGSQRPSNALSSDAALNLYNGLRVAGEPAARGLGVLVVLNDEIHAARDVAKTSTYRLQTFMSPDVGILGYCDSDAIQFYRKPVRPFSRRFDFEIANLQSLPKVTISYSYAGADGQNILDMVEAGARGIVVAGLPPGLCAESEVASLRHAAASGVIVVMASRGVSGRVAASEFTEQNGFLVADNLSPQKARLLLSLCLIEDRSLEDIQLAFSNH